MKYNSTSESSDRQYWTYTPGSNARGGWNFQADVEDEVMGLGQDELGDLHKYGTNVERLAKKMRSSYNTEGDGSGNARYMIQFRDDVRPGDVVFVKRGKFRLAGVGIVVGKYRYDHKREKRRQVRPMKWIWAFDKGKKSPVRFPVTTFTRLSDQSRIDALLSAAGLQMRDLAKYDNLRKPDVALTKHRSSIQSSAPTRTLTPQQAAARLKRITRTEQLREIVQREGQRELRDFLRSTRGQCEVTGLNVETLLVASHIKDWKSCSRKERLDPENVLLLAKNYDAAFDRKLISFDSKGRIIKSDVVDWKDLARIGIKKSARISRPSGSRAKYLKWHLARLVKLPVK